MVTLTQANAASGEDSLQKKIDKVLATTEGGTQISRNEIAFDGGEAILAFPLPGHRDAPPSSPAAVKLQAKRAGVSTKSVQASREAGAELAASDDCPTEVFGNDWYCFYQYENFGGQRLQWNAPHNHNDIKFFSEWGFENKTSSWSNKGGLVIYVEGRGETGLDKSCYDSRAIFLWGEQPHTSDSFVGTSLDNRADCFWTSDS
ncbi:peptidase inhibitor family I36 protein [Streptomyces longhuiensis]|uniref:peptidase inhibitor family I36 protein n=1 Tax=Streptomyces longhuiensis TaxID=2880933 RepID=UPI001D09A90B|nr:peptidase inhibitor family I36 protein [Streptomyces longhuiensis]UDM05398.1 peptidase inhibitor family I36 protein [Streptomyces longhuiensis]